jgi:hypothetical protein
VIDASIPLVNRGAEALEALLNYDEAKAEVQVRLLTMSEMTYLAIAAEQLAKLARSYTNRTCATCNGAIVWWNGAGQPWRWRHVDQTASHRPVVSK